MIGLLDGTDGTDGTGGADGAGAFGSEHVHFGLVEMDLLASYAGVEIPFPLRVPSFGQVQSERDVLLAAACETLQVRGLADDDGPLDLANQLVSLLANRVGAIDLVIGGADWNSGAVALVGPGNTVFCLQRFNDAERDLVEAYSVPTDSLDTELAGLLPTLTGGQSMPVRLPVAAVRAAQQLLLAAEREGDQDTNDVQRRLRDVLDEYGVSGGVVSKLVSLLHPLIGYGQMGATRPNRDGEHARVGAELSWIDSDSGRHAVSTAGGSDGSGWVSVNPLHPDELLGAVRRLVADVRP